MSALDVALMGALARPALVAAPGPRRARAGAGGARRRSASATAPARPSATSRAASASASSSPARSSRTRPSLLLDEPFTRPRRAERRPARGAARPPGGRGPRRCSSPPTTSSRPRAWDRVLCLNGRQVAFGAPGEVLTPRGARGDLRRRRSSTLPGGRRPGRCCPPTTTSTTTSAMSAVVARPGGPVVAGDPAPRASRRSSCSASPGGALGCWVVFDELSYSAESLAHALLPGPRRRGARSALPLLLGGAAGLLVAALGVALAGRAPEVGRDTAVAVVVTGAASALGVLLALSRDTPPGLAGPALRRRPRRLGHRPGARRRPGRRDARRAAAAARAAARRRASTASARAALGRAGRWWPTSRCWRCSRWPLLVAVQGLGNLLVVAVLIAPAAGARLLAHRMAPMMAVAAAIAVGSGWAACT